jgi:ADP-heptose:LPS heptosyltransferase
MSDIRQTIDFEKIYKTIDFFLKKKIKIIILGNNSDKSLPILKNKYLTNNKVLFFSDLSLNQSVIDQLYIHYYSLLSIGSDSGAFIMSIYLKKKIIFFDAIISPTYKFYKKNKNIVMLLKKIVVKKKIRALKYDDYLLKKKSKPIETSYDQIIKAYKSFY